MPTARAWTVELINSLFFATDAEAVRSIPLSSRAKLDACVWHLENVGIIL